MLGGRNKQHQPLGYTIVEVMIVLAVSGFMFVIAANFINGKQERAAFTQGSNDTVSKLQGVVEGVIDGHYSDVPLTCDKTTGQASTSGTGTQGETSDCVFLGKIVSFYASGGSDKNHYGIYSIAAARSITSFPNALISSVSGLTTDSAIPQSLYVKGMTIVDGGGTTHQNTYFNIGFLQDIGNVDSTGVYLSGAQQPVQLVYSNNNANISGTHIQKAKSATICLSDGSRYAEVFIGGPTSGRQSSSSNNNQLNISVQQLGATVCTS
jgi:Tfp pilus assembly protein FimT